MLDDLFWIKKRWRKKKHRNVDFDPIATDFTPNKAVDENEVYLLADELECLRLKNLKKLSVRDGAVKMWISKSLFAKIHNEAIIKITDALINWKQIKIKG